MTWAPTKDYGEMSAAQVGEEMRAVKKEKDEADAVAGDLSSHLEFLKKVAMPRALDREGLKNIRFADGKGITTTEELYVSIPSEKLQTFISWLDEHGEGDIAKRAVNAQTLKSWYKKGLKEGRDLPYDLVTAYPATVAKFLG